MEETPAEETYLLSLILGYSCWAVQCASWLITQSCKLFCYDINHRCYEGGVINVLQSLSSKSHQDSWRYGFHRKLHSLV